MAWKKFPCPTCNGERNYDAKQCVKCYRAARAAAVPSARVQSDRELHQKNAALSDLQMRYREALKTIERMEKEHGITAHLGDGIDTFRITPKKGSHTSEGTVVVAASDWHVEENVGAEVGGLNLFNMDIAKQRVERFFRSALRLTNLLQQDITIDTMVLALLGDFISNDIHDEFADITEVTPMHALIAAQNMAASGIEFLLKHSSLKLVVPCHSGNHARTTKTTRFSTENGHSLEYLMYCHLAAYFRHEPRVTFIIPEGMHSYLQVYDTMIRFQHGHAIKYGGGVGGIYIPVNKAIAQWNKARHADLDVFGHFHQMRDGGNFICNGSLIGYNAFALSIKADYEPPKQALFLIDKKRGRTCTWPIIFGDSR